MALAVGLVPAAAGVAAAPAKANGALVFTCGEGAHREGSQVYPEGICITDPDGGNSRRLDSDPASFTSSPGGDGEPVWSPDGTRIAWVRAVGQGTSGTIKELFVMNADGSGARQLTSDGGFAKAPSWSPDGTRIAFEQRNGVSVVDLDGATHRLTDRGGDPAWSPNGEQVAFVSHAGFYCVPGSDVCVGRNALYSMAADGTDVRLLSDVADLDFRAPSWAPDGTTVAVACSNRLCLVAAAGGELRRLDVDGAFPSWSPDGRRIAFSRVTYRSTATAYTSDVHLCLVDPDGSNARRIATGIDPSWQALATGGFQESASTLPCPRTPQSRRPELVSVDAGRGRLTARFGSLAGVDSATVVIATQPFRYVVPGGWVMPGVERRDSLTADEIAAQWWTYEWTLSPGTYYVRLETRDHDCDPCINGYSEALSVTVEPEGKNEKEKEKVEVLKRTQAFRGSVKVGRGRGVAYLTLRVRPLTQRLAYKACWTLKRTRRCARGVLAASDRETATHTLRVSTKQMRRTTRFTWYVKGRLVASRVRSF